MEDKEWLFRHAGGHIGRDGLLEVVTQLQIAGVSSLAELGALAPTSQQAALEQAGCEPPAAAAVGAALAGRYGPNVLALPEPAPARRIRSRRAELAAGLNSDEFDRRPFELGLRQAPRRQKREAGGRLARPVSCPIGALEMTPPRPVLPRKSLSCPAADTGGGLGLGFAPPASPVEALAAARSPLQLSLPLLVRPASVDGGLEDIAARLGRLAPTTSANTVGAKKTVSAGRQGRRRAKVKRKPTKLESAAALASALERGLEMKLEKRRELEAAALEGNWRCEEECSGHGVQSTAGEERVEEERKEDRQNEVLVWQAQACCK